MKKNLKQVTVTKPFIIRDMPNDRIVAEYDRGDQVWIFQDEDGDWKLAEFDAWVDIRFLDMGDENS